MSQIQRVWVFNGFRPMNPKYVDSLVEDYKSLNATDVVLGVSNDDKFYRLLSPPSDIIEYSKKFAAAGFAVHIMPWLHPDEAWMRAAANTCIPLVLEGSATSLLFDIEGTWVHQNEVRNTTRRAETFARFTELYLNQRQGDFLVGITTYPAGHVDPTLVPLLQLVDYIAPQTYSRAVRTQKDRAHGGAILKAGALQSWTWARLRKSNLQNKRIVWAFTTSQQDDPDYGGTFGTMTTALNAAIGYGAQEVAYWSYPGIRGEQRKFVSGILSGVSIDRSPLLVRRSRAMSGTSRLDAQYGYETELERQAAIYAANNVGPSTEEFRYTKEVFDTGGLLYDFDTGRWNDEA